MENLKGIKVSVSVNDRQKTYEFLDGDCVVFTAFSAEEALAFVAGVDLITKSLEKDSTAP